MEKPLSDYRSLVTVGMIAAALLCTSKSAIGQPELTARADSLAKAGADVLLVADAYTDAWQYEKALTALEISGRKDAPALWRKARACVDIAEGLKNDDALNLNEKAVSMATKAVRLDSTSADAQQMLAIAMGRMAIYKGVFANISLVKEIHTTALKALSLDDSLYRCCYIIGRLNQELINKPGFALKMLGIDWATEDSVIYYYDKALKLNPSLIQTRVRYAEFLKRHKQSPDKVIRLLDEALALPITDEQDVRAKEDARALKAKL